MLDSNTIQALVAEYRALEVRGRGCEWSFGKWADKVERAVAGDEVGISRFYVTILRLPSPTSAMHRRQARAYKLIQQRGVWVAAAWSGVQLLARIEDDKARRKAIDAVTREAAKSPHGTLAELRHLVEAGGRLVSDMIRDESVRALLRLPKRKASVSA